jgi:hypothetical protein
MDFVWRDADRAAWAGDHIDARLLELAFQAIAVDRHGVSAADLHDPDRPVQAGCLAGDLPQKSASDGPVAELLHRARQLSVPLDLSDFAEESQSFLGFGLVEPGYGETGMYNNPIARLDLF